MKILLIIPRYNFTNNISYEYTLPVGLAYLSSVMKKEGYDVTCLNLNHIPESIEEIVNKELDKEKYDIVCSGHMGIGYAVIEKIINVVKSHKSKPLFILGGIIISSETELIFKSLKPDFGVIGEGEITIIELLDAIENKKDFNKINGIIFEESNWKDSTPKIIITPPRAQIDDLDKLPMPDYESFGLKEKLDHSYCDGYNDYPRTYSLLGSRGCPFNCTFCYHPVSRYRTRNIDNIINEIKEAVKKYDINCFDIFDDLFSLNENRVKEFCEKIKQIHTSKGEFLKWTCQLSVHSVTKEMLKMLKDSGCYIVSFGFESYSPIVLKSMRKPITPEQIDNAIKLTMESRISLRGNFIFGDIAETKETAKETLDYWKNNCDGQVKIYFIQPYPGSEIYNCCINQGIIKDKLDFIKNKMAHLNWFNMTEKMTDQEIIDLKKEILKGRAKYYKYVIPKIKNDKDKKDVKEISIKCPYCKEEIKYKNCYIDNINYFSIETICKNCLRRFYTCSYLYYLTMKYYNQLDFFRKWYLTVRDSTRKKNL